ncbi:hypothetical protein ACWOFR_17070 [Carnobacterium gallinarum]|uniref:hypothetical protein n=1 Tax=Carnobacterium gallinarum TaxID=2749 RepID=UPI000550EB64|nr:hypothetical protein [Carnobacterium gallinarum]
MTEDRISDSIVKLMAKNVFRFSEYWYQNYVVKDLSQESHEKEYIVDYRMPIVQTITNGIQAIETRRIDSDSYLKMGASHFHLGLSYGEVEEKQFLMIQAMEEFLRKKIKQDNMPISEEEIQYYLQEFHKLNEKVAPLVNRGYLEEEKRQS